MPRSGGGSRPTGKANAFPLERHKGQDPGSGRREWSAPRPGGREPIKAEAPVPLMLAVRLTSQTPACSGTLSTVPSTPLLLELHVQEPSAGILRGVADLAVPLDAASDFPLPSCLVAFHQWTAAMLPQHTARTLNALLPHALSPGLPPLHPKHRMWTTPMCGTSHTSARHQK